MVRQPFMHFLIYSIKVQLKVFEDLYALSGPDVPRGAYVLHCRIKVHYAWRNVYLIAFVNNYSVYCLKS